MRLAIACTLALALLPADAFAGEAALPQPQIPASPAQEILRAKPEVVITPGTPADLAAGLSSMISSTGEVKPGTAIEISLRKFGVGESSDYFNSYATRFLSRMSFSLATSGMGEKDVGLSGGVRLVLWDMDDPLLDSIYATCAPNSDADACVDEARGECRKKFPNDSPAQAECVKHASGTIAECGTKRYRECLARSAGVADYPALMEKYAAAWKGNTAIMGAAVAFRLPEGLFSKAQGNAFAAWFAAGFQAGNHAQLVISGSWRQRIGPGAGFDTGGGGVRFRFGSDYLRGFVDAAVTANKPQAGDTAVTIPVAAGAEIQLGPTGFWAHVGLGAVLDPSHTEQIGALLVSSLNWGMGPLPNTR